MTVSTLTGGSAKGVFFNQLRLRSLTLTLTGDITLTEEHPPLLFLDPGGAARTITLPAEANSDGLAFFLMNTADALEIITVQDDTPATVATPTQNEGVWLFCDGETWHGVVATEA